MTFLIFLNRRTPNTGAVVPSAPVELGTRLGPATKIHYRRVCERPIDFLRNLGTRPGVTIYRYSVRPMVRRTD